MQVRSLGWEDPLKEGMATHSNILACRIPIVRGAWQATVHGVAKSDMTEQLSTWHTWQSLSLSSVGVLDQQLMRLIHTIM